MAVLSFPEPLCSLMRKSKVGDRITKSQSPVTVDAEMTAGEASAVLARHGISSAPIKSGDKFVGSFDFADLAELMVSTLSKNKDAKSLDSVLSLSSPVRLVTKERDALVSVEASATVEEAVSLLLEKKTIHRLCVFDNNEFVGMFSFSDALKFVADNIVELGDLLSPTVSTLQLSSAVTIAGNRPVIDALALMTAKKISSVAVMEDGELLTAITLTDVKTFVKLKKNNLDTMRIDCREFASHVRALQALDDEKGRETFPFFAVHPETTLKSTTAKLAATRAHRLFVVNDSTEPVGVIQIEDIFNAILAN